MQKAGAFQRRRVLRDDTTDLIADVPTGIEEPSTKNPLTKLRRVLSASIVSSAGSIRNPTFARTASKALATLHRRNDAASQTRLKSTHGRRWMPLSLRQLLSFLLAAVAVLYLVDWWYEVRPPSEGSDVTRTEGTTTRSVTAGESLRPNEALFWRDTNVLRAKPNVSSANLSVAEEWITRVAPRSVSEFGVQRRHIASSSGSEAWSEHSPLSVIAFCQDPDSVSLRALSSWQGVLNNNDELILMSWSSMSAHWEILAHQEALRVAATIAIGRRILHVGCDREVPSNFLGTHPLSYRENDTGIFYTDTPGIDDCLYKSGFWYARRSDAVDAMILPSRMRSLCMKGTRIDDDYVRRAARSIPRSNDRSLNHLIIQIALHKMLPWSEQYTFNRGYFGIYLDTSTKESRRASAVPTWSDGWSFSGLRLEYHMSPEGSISLSHSLDLSYNRLDTYKKQLVLRRSLDMVLHDGYGIPWDVLSQMDMPRSEILREVQTRDRSAPTWGRSPGLVFVELLGTTSDRILSLCSVLALAGRYGKLVFASWGPIEGVPGDKSQFPDVFRKQVVLPKEISVRFFTIRRWPCESSPKNCAVDDNAFERIIQHRSLHSHNEDIVRKVVSGTVNWKDHLILKLDSRLSSVISDDDLAAVLASLTPSVALTRAVEKFGSINGTLGLCIGSKMTRRATDALASRLNAQLGRDPGRKVFVIGREREAIEGVLHRMGSRAFSPFSSPSRRSPEDKVLMEVAGFYALGWYCRDVLLESECLASIAELTRLLRRGRVASTE